jgi:hypothetical protein
LYDLIVIGGGIAGLYTIYKYLNLIKDKKVKVKPKILLIESTSRLCGRIHTVDKINQSNKKHLIYEAGGARFSENHKLLFELIKDFKLESKLYALHSQKVFISSDDPTKEIKITNQLDKILNKIISEIDKKKNLYTEEYLLSKTFHQIANEVSPKLINEFTQLFPYYSEVYVMNARDAIINLKRDFNSQVQYYISKGGLEIITKKLISVIKPKIDILLDTPLKDFNFLNQNQDKNQNGNNERNLNENMYDIYAGNKHFKTSKLVLAIPSKNLLELPFIQKQKTSLNVSFKSLVKLVSPQPLFRIYAKYKTPWLSNHVITNSPLKYIIPYDNTGLIMISYTDGFYSKFWLKLYQQSEQKLIEVLNKKVKELFPNHQIPELEWVDANPYWEDGAHYWIPRKTHINANQLENEIRNPLNNLWIVGEAFSNYQAWVEGSLETSLKAVNTFN